VIVDEVLVVDVDFDGDGDLDGDVHALTRRWALSTAIAASRSADSGRAFLSTTYFWLGRSG
jgi:hypothetical protein